MTAILPKPPSVGKAQALDGQLSSIEAALGEINRVILGKDRAVRLAVSCLLARGHLLIEDLPGMGKTTLAHALARVLGLQYQRIQFTSDLLPADIVGAAIFERASETFVFHPGPVFAQVILADEINRATPKTQSALLEAMEERQVTVEGQTRPLPEPFFVIATQNPAHQVGTFPLPESQLDRFAMRLTLGYPDAQAERALLAGVDRREMVDTLEVCLTPEGLVDLQRRVPEVHTAPALLDYLQALLAHTRQSGWFQTGLSPRAGLSVLRVARAWALLHGRQHVLPEDIQGVLPAAIGHRLQAAELGGEGHDALIGRLIQSVELP
ncbi:MAG: AAA family ATPase [Candidatus Competibacterales bacterium]